MIKAETSFGVGGDYRQRLEYLKAAHEVADPGMTLQEINTLAANLQQPLTPVGEGMSVCNDLSAPCTPSAEILTLTDTSNKRVVGARKQNLESALDLADLNPGMTTQQINKVAVNLQQPLTELEPGVFRFDPSAPL